MTAVFLASDLVRSNAHRLLVRSEGWIFARIRATASSSDLMLLNETKVLISEVPTCDYGVPALCEPASGQHRCAAREHQARLPRAGRFTTPTLNPVQSDPYPRRNCHAKPTPPVPLQVGNCVSAFAARRNSPRLIQTE